MSWGSGGGTPTGEVSLIPRSNFCVKNKTMDLVLAVRSAPQARAASLISGGKTIISTTPNLSVTVPKDGGVELWLPALVYEGKGLPPTTSQEGMSDKHIIMDKINSLHVI